MSWAAKISSIASEPISATKYRPAFHQWASGWLVGPHQHYHWDRWGREGINGGIFARPPLINTNELQVTWLTFLCPCWKLARRRWLSITEGNACPKHLSWHWRRKLMTPAKYWACLWFIDIGPDNISSFFSNTITYETKWLLMSSIETRDPLPVSPQGGYSVKVHWGCDFGRLPIR